MYIEDEIDYLQVKEPEEIEFFTYKVTPLAKSYEKRYPEFYKIAGYSIFRTLDQQ